MFQSQPSLLCKASQGLSLRLRLRPCLQGGRGRGGREDRALLWGEGSASFCSGKTMQLPAFLEGLDMDMTPTDIFLLSHACTFPLK